MLSLFLRIVASGYEKKMHFFLWAFVDLFGCHGQSVCPKLTNLLCMCYYPAQYPNLKPRKKTDPLTARVIYSRPKKRATSLGGLVEYGQLWRLGANEATESSF